MPTGFVKSTIHAPGAARRAAALREVEDDGHGPQRLGEPAGAGRLLPDEPEPVGQRLVHEARRLATDPQLDEDEIGAVDARRRASSVRVSRPVQSRASSIRWARPPTIESRSASMSSRTSSSMAIRSARRTKPSTSSGVYVLPPPTTAILMPIHPPSDRTSASGLTRLLITLSAIRSRASPVRPAPSAPTAWRRSADGPLPARARTRAAPPPGLPRPASRASTTGRGRRATGCRPSGSWRRTTAAASSPSAGR